MEKQLDVFWQKHLPFIIITHGSLSALTTYSPALPLTIAVFTNSVEGLSLIHISYDHNGNQEFDAWKAEDISAKWQAGIIQIFMSAYDAMNTAGIEVNMPSFYIGAVETKPETLLNYYEKMDGVEVETHKGI